MRLSGVCISIVLAIGLSAASASVNGQQPAASPAKPGSAEAALKKLRPSYLPLDALPDSLALLPPPPATGSAAMQRDEEARQAALQLATARALPRRLPTPSSASPQVQNDFSCAMAIGISKEATPTLYALMGKMLVDVGLSTYKAKNHYKRARPFSVHKATTCYPKDEALLRAAVRA